MNGREREEKNRTASSAAGWLDGRIQFRMYVEYMRLDSRRSADSFRCRFRLELGLFPRRGRQKEMCAPCGYSNDVEIY